MKGTKHLHNVLIFSKQIGVIAFLFLIVFSSGCISNDEGSNNFTVVNKTGNNSYSVAGVSFRCPDNWVVATDNVNGNITIMASQIDEFNDSTSNSFGPVKAGYSAFSIDNPQFEVHITPNNGMSDQKAIDQVKNQISALENKISSEKWVVNGENAFKDVVIYNDTAELMRFEYIYFVKNGKTYLITFSAKDKDFNKEKTNFEMILNSFKVQ
jgi:hypothetical protein